MRRMILVALIAVTSTVWTQHARAGELSYAWELDPPPFGPNASAATNGSVLTLLGGGTVDHHGAGSGHGVFEIADRRGEVVAAGRWTITGRATVVDQGPLPEEVWEHLVQRGMVTAHIVLDGVGSGTIKVFCAAGKRHLEGFIVKVGKTTYGKVVTGSTAITRVPA